MLKKFPPVTAFIFGASFRHVTRSIATAAARSDPKRRHRHCLRLHHRRLHQQRAAAAPTLVELSQGQLTIFLYSDFFHPFLWNYRNQLKHQNVRRRMRQEVFDPTQHPFLCKYTIFVLFLLVFRVCSIAWNVFGLLLLAESYKVNRSCR